MLTGILLAFVIVFGLPVLCALAMWLDERSDPRRKRANTPGGPCKCGAGIVPPF